MERFLEELIAIAILLATLWLMGYGFAVMVQQGQWYRKQSAHLLGQCSRWAGGYTLRYTRRFLRWVGQQSWRFIRWGIPAAYRAIASLL